MVSHSLYLEAAIREALTGVRKGHGGPFGAVLVKDNRILASSHNEVIKRNDPTAHAEVLAIRAACRRLKRFDISDCVLYTTCEPCPMCLSAGYWAKLKQVYYGCTREDAARIGFDDKLIYDILRNPAVQGTVVQGTAVQGTVAPNPLTLNQLDPAGCLAVFLAYEQKSDKVLY
jgi:guanine deaminase